VVVAARPADAAARRSVPARRAGDRYNARMSTRRERARRSAARGRWPVRVCRLGDEDGGNLAATTTAEQRLAMMWPLALDAWSLTGRPLPDYERARAPVRRLAGGEPA